MTPEEERASRVYDRTRSLATGNAWVQGLSGIIGLGANLLVDAAVIPKYAELWTDIRKIYNRGSITASAATAYLKPNLNFLVQDLLWDKLVGSIPVIGIPFNVAFAKALTWRLGAWFGLLSALGEEHDARDTQVRGSMELTRLIFPTVGDVFSFKAPDKCKFIEFISSHDGLTKAEYEEAVGEALALIRRTKKS